MDQFERPGFKRVKERTVREAQNSVNLWRHYFEEGVRDQAGQIHKVNLKDAAEMVGVPKKTLEDYSQLLRKVDRVHGLDGLMDKKMGHLRTLIKDHKKNLKMQEEEQIQYDEEFTMNDEIEEQAAPPYCDDWEQMIDLTGQQYSHPYEFEFTYTVTQIIVPTVNKKIDDWENQSIDSDLETDSDDI